MKNLKEIIYSHLFNPILNAFSNYTELHSYTHAVLSHVVFSEWKCDSDRQGKCVSNNVLILDFSRDHIADCLGGYQVVLTAANQEHSVKIRTGENESFGVAQDRCDSVCIPEPNALP